MQQPNELTREQREDLLEIHNAATPDEWIVQDLGVDNLKRHNGCVRTETNRAITGWGNVCQRIEDARAIAAEHNAVPALLNHISELEAQLKDAIERCQKLNGIEARIEDLIAAASESGKYPKLHAWFDGDESADTDIDRGVQLWIGELEAQLAESRRELLRKHLDSPDMQTFVDLKHGIVGDVLLCLQEGEISLSKAAEALAEIAHGAATVPLPSHQGYFDEMETPVERCISLETALRGLRTEADSALALAAMRGEALTAITALDFEKDEKGRRNLYSGAPKFVTAWLMAEKALESTSPEEWLAERYASKEDADRINSQLVWAVNFLRGIGFAEEWMAAIPIKVSADQQGTAWLAERDKRMRAEGAAEWNEQQHEILTNHAAYQNIELNDEQGSYISLVKAAKHLEIAKQIRKEAGLS